MGVLNKFYKVPEGKPYKDYTDWLIAGTIAAIFIAGIIIFNN
mgnify:CR=1 FL=1